ncbi:hypothetical protein SKAU_G00096260 [Synaphobranchus kaupii]|uniref:Uncharacterized protein n=1 Tax=Synaphobranchus kaupii TaxID=118154 RepID=A0A9Q1FYI6_SYNKA|nr:hypothetical protein SKAU_G00096260 [Synaphobranchus kaupii]
MADAAKASTDATSYFGYVQKLYNLFSAAPQRWQVLKQHVNITLKSWSETRWESRINSVEPVRYQSPDIREALIQIRDKTTDATTRTTGFAATQSTAKDVCEEMNVEAVLQQKRRRRHFAYEAPDEPMFDPLKMLEAIFFNVVVDCAIQSLDDRF